MKWLCCHTHTHTHTTTTKPHTHHTKPHAYTPHQTTHTHHTKPHTTCMQAQACAHMSANTHTHKHTSTHTISLTDAFMHANHAYKHIHTHPQCTHLQAYVFPFWSSKRCRIPSGAESLLLLRTFLTSVLNCTLMPSFCW